MTTTNKTLTVTHWTTDEDLIYDLAARPQAIDTANEGLGLFVYPSHAEVEWTGRTRTTWQIDDQYVREVQRFEPGSLDGIEPRSLVIELFVDAINLDKLTRIS